MLTLRLLQCGCKHHPLACERYVANIGKEMQWSLSMFILKKHKHGTAPQHFSGTHHETTINCWLKDHEFSERCFLIFTNLIFFPGAMRCLQPNAANRHKQMGRICDQWCTKSWWRHHKCLAGKGHSLLFWRNWILNYWTQCHTLSNDLLMGKLAIKH